MTRRPLFPHLKKTFIAGVLVLAPVVAVAWTVRFLFRLADSGLAPALEKWLGYRIPGLGILFTLTAIYGVGLFARWWGGKKIVVLLDAFMQRVPLVRSVHRAVREIFGFLLKADGAIFEKTVLVEYPRGKVLGFVTGSAWNTREKRQYQTVFIPTPPNPTSGMMIVATDDQVEELNMTVEEGIKSVMTVGALFPKQFESKKAGPQ